jgi:hypothetical protein
VSVIFGGYLYVVILAYMPLCVVYRIVRILPAGVNELMCRYNLVFQCHAAVVLARCMLHSILHNFCL